MLWGKLIIFMPKNKIQFVLYWLHSNEPLHEMHVHGVQVECIRYCYI